MRVWSECVYDVAGTRTDGAGLSLTSESKEKPASAVIAVQSQDADQICRTTATNQLAYTVSQIEGPLEQHWG